MAIVIICLTSCGKTKLKDNPGGSNDNNNNNIVDKNGEFIIPEDYNPTDEKCFGFEEGIIKAFYCYEGNNYGIPTVTDLVIPYKINGEWVKKINTYDPDYIDQFDHKNINSLVLPNSVINISGWEFSRNPLTKIVLSESLQAIEEGT